MAETNSDGSDGSGSGGSIIDFFTQPLGMAMLGGIAIAIAAGYFIL